MKIIIGLHKKHERVFHSNGFLKKIAVFIFAVILRGEYKIILSIFYYISVKGCKIQAACGIIPLYLRIFILTTGLFKVVYDSETNTCVCAGSDTDCYTYYSFCTAGTG